MDYVINHTKAMEQWDYELNNKYNYDPKKMTVGSEIKVWWKCSKGHSFDMRICHKMRNEAGCPFCSGLRVCDDNNLEVLYPNLVKYWDNEKNTVKMNEITPNTTKVAYWICDNGHSFTMPINRRLKMKKCPICSGQRITIDNCLETVKPELAKEWNYEKNGDLSPKDVMSGTHKRVWWICSKCNNNYQMVIKHRSSGGKCPKCGLENANIAKYKKIINLDTGEIYNSLKEVAIKYKLSSTTAITACIRGKSKTCRGFRWAYYEENKKVNDK